MQGVIHTGSTDSFFNSLDAVDRKMNVTGRGVGRPGFWFAIDHPFQNERS